MTLQSGIKKYPVCSKINRKIPNNICDGEKGEGAAFHVILLVSQNGLRRIIGYRIIWDSIQILEILPEMGVHAKKRAA
jgi:hypothetical protein